MKLLGFHQSFHEVDLIETGFQKEFYKRGERGLAEIASSVPVAASRLVASLQMLLVFSFVPGKTPRYRP